MAAATKASEIRCDSEHYNVSHLPSIASAKRLQKMGNPKYRNGFDLTIQETALDVPLRWKKPQTIFVNSMSDLFHEDIEENYVQRVFDVDLPQPAIIL